MHVRSAELHRQAGALGSRSISRDKGDGSLRPPPDLFSVPFHLSPRYRWPHPTSLSAPPSPGPDTNSPPSSFPCFNLQKRAELEVRHPPTPLQAVPVLLYAAFCVPAVTKATESDPSRPEEPPFPRAVFIPFFSAPLPAQPLGEPGSTFSAGLSSHGSPLASLTLYFVSTSASPSCPRPSGCPTGETGHVTRCAAVPGRRGAASGRVVALSADLALSLCPHLPGAFVVNPSAGT